MTKSTITRERIQQIFLGNGTEPSASEERELARIALAAMDSSESVELPLDYLQGHKDGLEWAAQLAEANHPETGDWLYDDPIELAKAIRKGPDMPPAQPVADSEPVAYMTYKGYLLHAGDPKLAEYSEPMPLYADPRPEPISAEPVAWLLSGGGAKNVVVFDGGNAYADPLREVTPLYRHAQPAPVSYSDFEEFWSAYIHPLAQDDELKGFAWDIWSVLGSNSQPAPVVPEEVTAEDCPALVKYDVTEVDEAWARGFNSCRAAMLQAYPVCTCPSGDGSLRRPCPVHPGNSPTQSDCCPAQNSVTPAQNQGWIPVSERMPENDGAYLCWDNRYVTTCAFIFGAWQANQFIAKNITHWMPLPAGPQGVPDGK
ncbi:Eaa1 [Klebsiella pneumoniae]|nr:Eaa1 [Klebsiella pneumoniae]